MDTLQHQRVVAIRDPDILSVIGHVVAYLEKVVVEEWEIARGNLPHM